jgi:uncharacterized protein (DUF1778 family)
MSTQESRGPGRPALPEGEGKEKMTGFRARPDERASIERAAEIAGLTLSEWLRQRAVAAAQREIKRADGNQRR